MANRANGQIAAISTQWQRCSPATQLHSCEGDSPGWLRGDHGHHHGHHHGHDRGTHTHTLTLTHRHDHTRPYTAIADDAAGHRYGRPNKSLLSRCSIPAARCEQHFRALRFAVIGNVG
ncbi:hypothetical protein AOQ84DRAFT_391525 [Glonium stellatum]|uniref:Uncharacterized protein n=1 Tax=Glonium stellatum TaxID=574774 RepID=A0A8E2ETB8_9PEZI|nr:hypothetical protein AOQ84DRAFT_391525 [Glonium stellatum]